MPTGLLLSEDLRARVREQVITARREQHLDDHVSDERFLDDLARDVLQGGGPR